MSNKPTDLDTPLPFDLPPQQPKRRPRPIKTVAQGKCPNHVSDKGTLVGIVRGGKHLYWKPHHVNTYGSSKLCSASNASLCVVPSLSTWPARETPECDCMRGKK
jgi:hypothetical protein